MPDPLPFVDPNFRFSRSRTVYRYAIQVEDMAARRKVFCFIVRVDVSGGMPIPAIKRRLTEKVINYIANRWPGQLQMKGIVVGRVDDEI